MSKRFIATLVLLLSMTFLALSKGDSAPDFAAKNQDGKLVHLSDFKGRPVLLYFYPKDDTPGCTKEACSFRDEYQKFKDLGAVILGVSRQDEMSHRVFREKHKLPFDLLVDQDQSISKAYGIDSIPLARLLKRQSVLVGADGKIIRVYPNVDPGKHSSEVLNDLQDYAIHSGKHS